MRRMQAMMLGLCAGLLVPGWCFAAPVAAPLTLEQIVEKTLGRDDVRRNMLLKMQYDQTATVDQLDDKGGVTKHETLQMIIYPDGHPRMKIVSIKGDHIPTDPDQAEAQEKGNDVEGNKDNFTLRTLVTRFDLALTDETKLNGRAVHVIAFTPKLDQPYKDETEKVINQLHGKMWISADTFDVLQTEASLAAPVSIAWFLASIPKLDFHYRRPDISQIFSPCQVEINLEVDAFVVGFHQRQIVDMKNFKARE